LSIAGSAAARPIPAPGYWHNAGLGMLPAIFHAETRQVSPENPTGGKGMGARAIPKPNDPNLPFDKAAMDLGQGWKVSPFYKPKAGETLTIMDVEGPGVIQHIWIATEEVGSEMGVRASCGSIGTMRTRPLSKYH